MSQGDLFGDRTAVISGDGRYRYELRRRWSDGAPALFVMLNPSTADAAQDDATVRRCVGFARRLGCGGLVVVNLYAYRATDPADLKRAHAAGVDVVGPGNDDVIGRAAGAIESVIVAWGAYSGPVRGRDEAVLALLSGQAIRALGTTAHGAPRHPLYTPSNSRLCRFPGGS